MTRDAVTAAVDLCTSSIPSRIVSPPLVGLASGGEAYYSGQCVAQSVHRIAHAVDEGLILEAYLHLEFEILELDGGAHSDAAVGRVARENSCDAVGSTTGVDGLD